MRQLLTLAAALAALTAALDAGPGPDVGSDTATTGGCVALIGAVGDIACKDPPRNNRRVCQCETSPPRFRHALGTGQPAVRPAEGGSRRPSEQRIPLHARLLPSPLLRLAEVPARELGRELRPGRSAGFWRLLYRAGADVILVGHNHKPAVGAAGPERRLPTPHGHRAVRRGDRRPQPERVRQPLDPEGEPGGRLVGRLRDPADALRVGEVRLPYVGAPGQPRFNDSGREVPCH